MKVDQLTLWYEDKGNQRVIINFRRNPSLSNSSRHVFPREKEQKVRLSPNLLSYLGTGKKVLVHMQICKSEIYAL